MIKLTKHERHARLVKIVRRTYQADNPGSRLFPNNSGIAWQGNPQNGAGKVELFNPRPIRFGIPEPDGNGTKSGGTDLLGETPVRVISIPDPTHNIGIDLIKSRKVKEFPVLTGIECKSGKGKLKKNQKIFRDWMKKINAIWYRAQECNCQENWIPLYRASKIIDWEIPRCELCNSKGFILEDE